jgi:hypothetical protein
MQFEKKKQFIILAIVIIFKGPPGLFLLPPFAYFYLNCFKTFYMGYMGLYFLTDPTERVQASLEAIANLLVAASKYRASTKFKQPSYPHRPLYNRFAFLYNNIQDEQDN